MINFIIVKIKKRILVICSTILLALLIATLIMTQVGNSPPTKASVLSQSVISTLSPELENQRLKDLLSNIIPNSNNILFEDGMRNVGNPNSSDTASVSTLEALKNGKQLNFNIIYSNEDYLRPIYDVSWKDAYFRGWLYLPKKIISSRHTLFTYVGGASNIFDIEGELGFYPNISIDNINKINFLVYNFDVNKITLLNQQVVLSGMTRKRGVELITLNIDDIPPTPENSKLLVQLCTPNGYEIDYQNVEYSKLAQQPEDYGLAIDSPTEVIPAKESQPVDLKKENELLSQELTHYISNSSKPLYFQFNGSFQTSNILNSTIDLEDALKNALPIDYDIIYNNKTYKTPVFHPEWREHYDRDWCYIPRKMYINMKRVFVLPEDADVAYDLCGELGFFQSYPKIEKDKIAILVNNFNVTKVETYEDNVLMQGTPSRTGMQVVVIPKSKLIKGTEYAVRLVTSDECEIDVDVIKN